MNGEVIAAMALMMMVLFGVVLFGLSRLSRRCGVSILLPVGLFATVVLLACVGCMVLMHDPGPGETRWYHYVMVGVMMLSCSTLVICGLAFGLGDGTNGYSSGSDP